jgi:hypothetical protein
MVMVYLCYDWPDSILYVRNHCRSELNRLRDVVVSHWFHSKVLGTQIGWDDSIGRRVHSPELGPEGEWWNDKDATM